MAATIYACSVQSAWAGSGTKADPYRPQVAVDYGLMSWSQASGTAPPGGIVNVSCQMHETDYQNIQANPTYAGKVTLQGTHL